MRLVQVAGLANRARIPRAGVDGHPPDPSRTGRGALSRVQLPGAQQYHESSLQRPGDHAQCPDIAQIHCGQKVSELYAVPAFVQQHALAIGVVEYCGVLLFSFIADQGATGPGCDGRVRHRVLR